MELRKQTKSEEVVNAVLHGIGLGLAFAALIILLLLAREFGDAWHIAGFSIYGTTLIILYFSSTMYHSLPEGKWKNVFHLSDHISIFLLIAGTYTPITLIAMRGPWGWTIFGVIWGSALLGIILKVFWFNRFKVFTLILYAVMGWMIVVAIKPLVSSLNNLSLIFLLLGGVAYSVGIIFYVWRKLKYSHGIWHILVLAGSIFHFFTMLFLIPR